MASMFKAASIQNYPHSLGDSHLVASFQILATYVVSIVNSANVKNSNITNHNFAKLNLVFFNIFNIRKTNTYTQLA